VYSLVGDPVISKDRGPCYRDSATRGGWPQRPCPPGLRAA